MLNFLVFFVVVISQLCSDLWGKRDAHFFLTFTPPILNFIALYFHNCFSFGSSSYQKKVL